MVWALKTKWWIFKEILKNVKNLKMKIEERKLKKPYRRKWILFTNTGCLV